MTHDGFVNLPILRGRKFRLYVSTALGGELLGVRELGDGRWPITCADLDLGTVHPDVHRIET